jgi:poly(A) polymerase
MARRAQADGSVSAGGQPRTVAGTTSPRKRRTSPPTRKKKVMETNDLPAAVEPAREELLVIPAIPTHSLVRHPVDLDEEAIDPDVGRVVRRLTRAGHQAYLVGGCIRDLLLGRKPKDFDVATSARPEDVRALFRNSRIIGRRFRLVHVWFADRKIFEVATFRRNPRPNDEQEATADDTDLLIRNDNVFGTVDEDAARRDFTINALFYDVEHREILDFFDGLNDIKRRAVRTIGDPIVRFREDPVRILRAIKFAGKLDLGIDPDVIDAMLVTRDDLALAAKPRLFEEILRLVRGGAARRSIYLAWDFGLLHVLLPELATLLDDMDGDQGPSTRVFRLLAELDERTLQRGEAFDDTIIWTLLLLEPLLETVDGSRDRVAGVIDFCAPIHARLAVHRRISDAMRRIIAALPRLFAGKLGRFARTELFEQAFTVAEIAMTVRGDHSGVQRLRQAAGRATQPTRKREVQQRLSQRRQRR